MVELYEALDIIPCNRSSFLSALCHEPSEFPNVQVVVLEARPAGLGTIALNQMLPAPNPVNVANDGAVTGTGCRLPVLLVLAV